MPSKGLKADRFRSDRYVFPVARHIGVSESDRSRRGQSASARRWWRRFRFRRRGGGDHHVTSCGLPTHARTCRSPLAAHTRTQCKQTYRPSVLTLLARHLRDRWRMLFCSCNRRTSVQSVNSFTDELLLNSVGLLRQPFLPRYTSGRLVQRGLYS